MKVAPLDIVGNLQYIWQAFDLLIKPEVKLTVNLSFINEC